MNLKKAFALVLAICLTLTMAACSKEGAVYVQSVEDLASMGGIVPGDRFAGIVVSENVAEIKKTAKRPFLNFWSRKAMMSRKGILCFPTTPKSFS